MSDAASTVQGRQSTSATTPLRGSGSPDPSGLHVLRDTSSTYRDGAEQAVLQMLREADDLRSDGTDLRTSAVGWAQRYHLDPARANILRCLDLPPTARVLEIGAGCGAITRYLGETCAVVDALEPVAVRAEAARARTRDLPGVEVFVGDLDDVPAVAAYDVVVVIGVLEYVGAGTADRTPYLDFLEKVADRLVDGGTLALAIENRLGVKYLVGAPEDHTNRVFDSVEGYPRGGNAHTFNRRDLEGLMGHAGLTPVTFTAFPDYKLTRAVFGQLPPACRSLLHRIPTFPSPDWRSPRPRLADERLLWRQLVDAGLDRDFGNSFLVLATKGDGPSLWPEGRAGAFYTTNRIPTLNTATMVETSGESVQFRRTTLRPAAGDDAGQGPEFRIIESVSPFQEGTDLTEVVATGGVDVWRDLAGQWLRLIDATLAEHPESVFDVVPHNLVVDDTGEIHLIDIELSCRQMSRDQVIRRGVFWLAARSAPLAPPERWAPARTVGDLMRMLGEAVGLPADGAWIERAIAEETELLTRVLAGPPAGEQRARWCRGTTSMLQTEASRSLSDMPLGKRLPQRAEAAKSAVAAVRRAASKARKRAAGADKEHSAALRKLAAAKAARRRQERLIAVRAERRARRAAARLLPVGTHRRRVIQRLRRR